MMHLRWDVEIQAVQEKEWDLPQRAAVSLYISEQHVFVLHQHGKGSADDGIAVATLLLNLCFGYG